MYLKYCTALVYVYEHMGPSTRELWVWASVSAPPGPVESAVRSVNDPLMFTASNAAVKLRACCLYLEGAGLHCKRMYH